ncbi:hypothetical protein FPRO03_13841 [Fusarium proliferatum]|uniref:Uncharacterized protein n=1 Tax=Gibberella intermedia TaxID=948311 RepID=A0A365MNW2_GIBIN|nr:hypothetical protein FPRO03_13841 [Fusarium proliferatum]RBA10206.1 hypothetical protein FPRO05_06142 [Fusarium proliferatum]
MAVAENIRVRRRDRSNENFKKKWSTLKNNGLIIHHIYNAEVYICIRRKGEKYEFKSTDKALPLSDKEKNESFPLPVLATAADVARQRDGQKPVKGGEQRQERSPEWRVLIENPLSEPKGGSEAEPGEE